MKRVESIECIRQRCRIDDETGCWLWAGALDTQTKRPIMSMLTEDGTRRCCKLSVAFHLIRTGKRPGHGARIYWPVACGNKQCANPEHHKPLTKSKLNELITGHGPLSRARIAMARAGKGRITESERREISGSPMKLAEIMDKYNVSQGYASILRRGLRRSGVQPTFSVQGSSVFTWSGAA
jgi:hypothetical protein